jgi:hypothetical protein
MATTKKPLSRKKPAEKSRWRWTGWAGLGAVAVFVVAALQGAAGNLISDWLENRASRPEFQFRFLALDLQRPGLTRDSSFPLQDKTLSLIFSGAPVYVQHNEVLSKAAYIVTSFLGQFNLGVQGHPSLEEYESLLTSEEKFMKAERGATNGEILWGLDVIASNRRLLERGVLTSEPARQLARENLDRGAFFSVQVDDIRAHCDADLNTPDHSFEEQVHAPNFRLILLDITNISAAPAKDLSLDSRKYRTGGPPLRLFTTLAPSPLDPVETGYASFPIGVLQRGEHILVPLIILAEKPFLWTPDSPSPPLTRHLTSTVDINDARADRVEFYRSKLSESEEAFYYFGPAVQITSVNAGQTKTPVRNLAMQNFTYSTVAVAGVGSCPSLSFRLADDSWTPLRHILIGAEGKGREREEVHTLENFGGELLLREEDNETSFLSRVAVEITGQGSTKICLPGENVATSPAGGHFVLHRHGELRVSCALRTGETARLIVKGYYESANN